MTEAQCIHQREVWEDRSPAGYLEQLGMSGGAGLSKLPERLEEWKPGDTIGPVVYFSTS